MNDRTHHNATPGRPSWWTTIRAWFVLTRREQTALLVLLALFLLGLTARYRHLARQQPEPYMPPVVGKVN